MTDPLFEKPISDLRRRMLQDMTNRNFGAKTQHDYIRHIETFAKFLGRAPDTATGDDIRRFQSDKCARFTAAKDEHAGVCIALLPRHHLSVVPISLTRSPARITRRSCRVCSRPTMWRVCWKRHLVPASSTRRR